MTTLRIKRYVVPKSVKLLIKLTSIAVKYHIYVGFVLDEIYLMYIRIVWYKCRITFLL